MPEQEDTELDKAGLAELTKKRLVYAIPNMEQVPVQKNVTYKTADGVELQMDVYHPIDLQRSSRRPAVIFVHGDAPPEFLKDAKDWGQYISWGQLTAASGLIAITFNHRSTEEFTKVYEVASDIDDLINYVRNHAEALHIDEDSIWVHLVCEQQCAKRPDLYNVLSPTTGLPTSKPTTMRLWSLRTNLSKVHPYLAMKTLKSFRQHII